MGSLAKTPINYREELAKARDLMSTKGTDLDRLEYTLALLLLQPENDFQDVYRATLMELAMRRGYMEVQKIFGKYNG